MRARIACVAVAVLLVQGCGSDSVGPRGGRLQVSVATSGADLDLDGYEIILDGVAHTIATNGVLTLVDVAAGEHQITLRELADNCTVSGSATQTVLVQQGTITRVEFVVACAVAGIEITIITTGPDADINGYHFEIAPVTTCDPGQPPCVPIGPPLPAVAEAELDAAGSTSITRLSPGYYEVQLSEVASNCAPAESASRVVAVTLGALVQASFAVSCVAVTGVIQVTVTTTGEDRDLDGYILSVADVSPFGFAIDGSIDVGYVAPGSHTVTLSDVTANCTDPQGLTRTVQVTAGGAVRDTARVPFQLDCRRYWELAFSRQGTFGLEVMLMTADGSDAVSLGEGFSPSWAPDGHQLAFATYLGCDYYYYHYCNLTYLYRMTVIGGAPALRTPLSNLGTDGDPAWSPTSDQIAFIRLGGLPGAALHVMNTSGSPAQLLPVPVQWVAEPAWSPDGTRLVFTCASEDGTNNDLCAVNADGTGFIRLTRGLEDDAAPAWSPDGTRIAFATNRFSQSAQRDIAVMNADGTQATRLSEGVEPAWTPDGQRIAFVGMTCSTKGSCNRHGLFLIDASGSGLLRLTTNPSDATPAWRPR